VVFAASIIIPSALSLIHFSGTGVYRGTDSDCARDVLDDVTPADVVEQSESCGDQSCVDRYNFGPP